MNRAEAAWQNRPRVLMTGPMAPAVGGMATVIEQLLAGPLARHCTVVRRPANPLQCTGAPRRRLWRSARRHLGQIIDLTRDLRRNAIDVVHIHTCSGFTFYRNLVDAAVARCCGVPVALHIHGAQFDQFCARAGRLGRWFIRRGLTAADCVVVLSDRWATVLRPYAPEAGFVVVPNGVVVPESAGDQHRAIPSGRCRFVFLAAVCRRKGIDVLLEAARQLRDRDTDFRLTIAGPEEQPGEARQLADEIDRRRLRGVVDYVGTVTGPDRDALLQDCDCLVLPSRAEGLPLTLLEAGARGRAVVAAAVGAVPEVITGPELGLLVSPADSFELSQAMETLARDQSAREALGKALRRRIIARYSLEQQSSLLAKLYSELCSGRDERRAARIALTGGGGT